MKAETLERQWKELKAELKIHWGKLTDDDLAVIDGNIDKLAARVQEVYGEARDSVYETVRKLVEKAQAALDKHDKHDKKS